MCFTHNFFHFALHHLISISKSRIKSLNMISNTAHVLRNEKNNSSKFIFKTSEKRNIYWICNKQCNVFIWEMILMNKWKACLGEYVAWSYRAHHTCLNDEVYIIVGLECYQKEMLCKKPSPNIYIFKACSRRYTHGTMHLAHFF